MSDSLDLTLTEPIVAHVPKRRLTVRQWAEIKALWESGNTTLDELSKRYLVSVSSFTRHFAAKGIKKGSKAEAIEKKAAAKVEQMAISEATVIAGRIRETKEQHYTMATNIAKLTWNEILQAKAGKLPFSTALNNLKALDVASNILKKSREERYAVLGLDRPDAVDPDELPELVISELTAGEIQELRDRDHADMEASITAAPITDIEDDEDEGDNQVIEQN